MTRDEFIKAKLFMFSDIEREIQIARADGQDLRALGINAGGGNFLAALGLLCYTEFGGKLRSAVTRRNGTDTASRNFNLFFDLLDPDYKVFRSQHNVYGIFRCGLAHQYFTKKGCAIEMLATEGRSGIGVDPSGRYFFVVESYCHTLRKGFDKLEIFLYGC